MGDPRWDAFVELYGGLPRQGPGTAAATLAALERVPALRDSPRVIDAGCGSGAATLALAKALPRARILAVDILDELLDRLRRELLAAELEGRVEVRNQSMDALSEAPASVDLIWCEAAIYAIGLERALRTWSSLLRPGGLVVFSEACWFGPPERRPAELVDFWAREYPAMRDESEVVEVAQTLGYRCLDTRRLEPEDWLVDYYRPLLQRCQLLAQAGDPIMAEVIAAAELEVAIFEDHCDLYGYTFFITQHQPSR